MSRKVYLLYDGRDRLLGIYTSQTKVKQAQLNVAERVIPNFHQVWQNYLAYWLNYHQVEYLDHPQPSEQLILDQFLSEDCHLLIQEEFLNQTDLSNDVQKSLAKIMPQQCLYSYSSFR